VLFVARDDTARKKMEVALREAEENYKGIFEHAVMGIAKCTAEGSFVSVNPALARIYGYSSPEELLAEMATRGGQLYLDPLRREELASQLRQNNEVSGFESQVVRKDGTSVWVSENVQTARDADGKISYYIITVEDVTARKQAEKELRLLANTITCAKDCFVLSDLEGKILFVNEALLSMYGYNDQDLLGKDVTVLLSPETPASLMKEIYSTASAGWNGELTHRRKDGTDIPVELWVSVVWSDSGEPIAHVGVARDISGRKRTEESLRLNESRLETLLRLNEMTGASVNQITDFALEEGVRLTKSKIGYLAFMNEDETVLTMHAWSKSAMDECQMREKPQVYPLGLTGLWGETARQRKPLIINDYEMPNPLKRGLPPGHIPIKRHLGIPVFDGEKIVAVAGVANREEEYGDSDVRQLTLLMEGMWLLVQRQRAEQKIRTSLKEKEILLKEIHHRVKNNLQIISSLLNLQTGQVKDLHLLEMLRESQNRIRSMALIHERLYRSADLSRVDFGHYVNELITFLVRSYARDSRLFTLHVDVQEVSLGVDVAIPCGLILNELVSNCLKHAFPHGRQGEILVMLRKEREGYLLRVRDDGIGLPPDIDVKKAESLGLQLVETLSTQIGATVEVATAPGQGTTFSIEFRAR
jgi:PAS domain S-box-containing protein